MIEKFQIIFLEMNIERTSGTYIDIAVSSITIKLA